MSNASRTKTAPKSWIRDCHKAANNIELGVARTPLYSLLQINQKAHNRMAALFRGAESKELNLPYQRAVGWDTLCGQEGVLALCFMAAMVEAGDA